MERLTYTTFDRPQNLAGREDPAALYAKSYLVIRSVVGLLGVVLPIVFIVGEFFLRGGIHVRGSLSAYYHTSMRDWFVAGLCVTGVLLATYMSAQIKTWDFWLSLVAGVMVVLVAFFPTSRPGLPPDAPRCGADPMPAGCAPLQQALGETPVAAVHFGCAAIFILCLAALSFVFSRREKEFENDVRMARTQKICGFVILAAVAWIVVGGLLHATVWEITPLYLGEVLSVWAFGVSWLIKGRDLRDLLGLRK